MFWLCVSQSFVIALISLLKSSLVKTYLSLHLCPPHPVLAVGSKMLNFPFSWYLLLLCLCAVESKTITSTITFSVPLPSSTQISSTYSADADFQSSILNSTNFYRKQHNASDLIWNNSLATYAASYAEKCLWAHSVRFRQHNPVVSTFTFGCCY